MSSKETRVIRVCRECVAVCSDRLCQCGKLPEPYLAMSDLPTAVAEELRAKFLPLNTKDGLKAPPHNLD